MPKSKVMELAIKIAGKVDKSLGKSVKTSSKQLNSIVKVANRVSTGVAAGMAAVGTGALAAGKYMTGLANEWQQATTQVANATGAAGRELETLRGVMEDVYASGFGEDVAAIGDAVAIVDRNMKDLSKGGLTSATKGALALQQAFDYDVAESTRAAEAIRKNFNVSVEDAFNLIATGAQNGLDFSGELIDSINEYSVQFAKLGFSADQMFQVYQAGADGTAWNLDKVGDAVKEFSIRAIDGSDTTIAAYQALGLNADQMMDRFAAGGEGANKAFFDVIDRLLDLDDKVQRDAVGVKLFGTMWEDLGVDALQAMADASDAAYATGDAIEQINQASLSGLDSTVRQIGRQFEVAMLPAAERVYNTLTDRAPEIANAISNLSPVVEEIAGDFADMATDAITDGLPELVDGIRDFANWAGVAYDKAKPFLDFLWENKGTVMAFAVGLRAVGPAVNTVTKAMNAVSTVKNWVSSIKTGLALFQASGGLTKAVGVFKALGSAMMGPLGILLAIGAGLVLLYQNWDKVNAAVTSFIVSISEKFPTAAAALQAFWSGIQAAAGNAQAIIQNLCDFVNNVFAGNWEAAWQNIVNIFGNLFGMLGNIVAAPINAVIALINKAIEGVNSISVTIPDWVPVVGGSTLGFDIPTFSTIPTIPSVPQLADGGVATGPTLAEIGEGGEPEAVLPLSKLAAMLDGRGGKPSPAGTPPGGDTIVWSPVFNFYGSTPTRQEAEEVGRISFAEFKRLYNQMKAEERRKNFRIGVT